MTTARDSSPAAIRAAVASGDYERASILWNDYAACLREELGRGAFSAARLAEVRGLVEWTRSVVLCAHSHSRARLNQLQAAAKYDQPAPSQASRLLQRTF
jgi:hypothetical protein